MSWNCRSRRKNIAAFFAAFGQAMVPQTQRHKHKQNKSLGSSKSKNVSASKESTNNVKKTNHRMEENICKLYVQ